MKTPSEELAELILPLLAETRLLLPEDANKYKEKLTSGTMKAEDWLLAAEKAFDKEAAK
ncbi:conserved protein of unknown function [Cupriavidus taiwanensis]|uniref:Uncharacterized protein n=1 Tax=Cupriavidus taiwanensis TaxID=164546 RepID=A0A375I9S2_9BURK|nr:hypothetical protein [Cupriavidus taiwanensis]SPK70830.1 conserved protein of unknown function [Cupriavidus taiwanensis]